MSDKSLKIAPGKGGMKCSVCSKDLNGKKVYYMPSVFNILYTPDLNGIKKYCSKTCYNHKPGWSI